MRDTPLDQQFIIFRVGFAVCAVPARLVDSIVSPQTLHQFSNQAPYILGVLPYRDNAAAIVNLFHKFNQTEPANTSVNARYILGITKEGITGFWVDEVLEVTGQIELHKTLPPIFAGDQIFDHTYLWRDKFVLSTDFDRLIIMNDSSPLLSWLTEMGENAISTIYPNGQVESTDIVAWSEPVDDVSEKRLSRLHLLGDDYSHPVLLDQPGQDVVPEKEQEIAPEIVQEVAPKIAPEIVEEKVSEVITEKKPETVPDVDEEMLIAIANEHGDNMTMANEPVEQHIDEDKSLSKKTALLPNQNALQIMITDYITSDSGSNSGSPVNQPEDEAVYSKVDSLSLLKQHPPQKNNESFSHASSYTPVYELQDVQETVIVDLQHRLFNESVSQFFLENIKSKVVAYDKSIHQAKTCVEAVSEINTVSPPHNIEKPDEQGAQAQIEARIESTEEDHTVARQKVMQQEKALDRVVHRIIEKHEHKSGTSPLRVPASILISAIAVFAIQHYWLNPSVDEKREVETLVLIKTSLHDEFNAAAPITIPHETKPLNEIRSETIHPKKVAIDKQVIEQQSLAIGDQ